MATEIATEIPEEETALIFFAVEGKKERGGAVSMHCVLRPDLMGYGRSPEEALDDLREALVIFKDGVVSMAKRRRERLEDILDTNNVFHTPDPMIDVLRLAHPEYLMLTIPLSAQGSDKQRPYLTRADFFGPRNP